MFIFNWLIFSYQPLNLLWIFMLYMIFLFLVFFNNFNLWFFCIFIILFLRGIGIIVLYFIRVSYLYTPHTHDMYVTIIPLIRRLFFFQNWINFNFNSNNYSIYLEINWILLIFFRIFFLLFAILGTIKILEIFKGSLKIKFLLFNNFLFYK